LKFGEPFDKEEFTAKLTCQSTMPNVWSFGHSEQVGNWRN